MPFGILFTRISCGRIKHYGAGKRRSLWARSRPEVLVQLGGPMGGLRWTAVFSAVLITPFLFVAVLPALLPILGARSQKESREAGDRTLLAVWMVHSG